MVKIAQDGIRLAKRHSRLARRDSTIAREASNHYYYRPPDLVEKVRNCRQVIEAHEEVQANRRSRPAT